MNKKRFCLILSLIILMTIFFFNMNNSLAWNVDWDVQNNGDINGGLQTTAQNTTRSILDVIRVVGTGISIIMITFVAIKYMSAAPSEKAEFKKSAVALIVGAIVLFAGTNIVTIIYNFSGKNIKA